MEVISTIAGKEQEKAGLLTEDFEDSECDCWFLSYLFYDYEILSTD